MVLYGRAPLEVSAEGVKLSPGDAAYRCNMVTYEDADVPFGEKRILSHNAGSIEGDESIAIITALFDNPVFKAAAEKAGISVLKSPSFRHFAIQKNADIKGIKLIPPHDHLGEKIGEILPSGCDNAAVLKELMILAHTILDHHPSTRREEQPERCLQTAYGSGQRVLPWRYRALSNIIIRPAA